MTSGSAPDAVNTGAGPADGPAEGLGDGDPSGPASQVLRLRPVVRGVRDVGLGFDRVRRRLAGDLEVTAAGLNAMGWLEAQGQLTPSGLARRLGLSLSAVTSLIDGLVKTGYARRTQHPDDRRSSLVQLTPAGRHAAAWAYEQITEEVTEALAGMGAEQVENGSAVLLTVGRQLIGADVEPSS